MAKDPITIKKGDNLNKAHKLMAKNSIRHLPVMDRGKLLGIITESDVRGAFLSMSNRDGNSADPAKMKVLDYMTKDPLTVNPTTNMEDAALLIYKNKVGGLPVVDGKKLVGIITTMDMLGLFVDMMGILHSSSRVDVVMGKDPKNFEKVSKVIHDQNLNIISVGMSAYDKDKSKQVYFFRLDLCETSKVAKKIKAAGFQVLATID